MPLVNNERTKLTAPWINTLAAATVATGVLAPICCRRVRAPDVRNGVTRWVCPCDHSLASSWNRTTFVGERPSWEITRMRAFELYALFGAPLVLLLTVAAV